VVTLFRVIAATFGPKAQPFPQPRAPPGGTKCRDFRIGPTGQPFFGANAWPLVRKPDAGKPPVRFDEREVETEHGMRLLRHARGNPDTELCRRLPHRATSRLYSTPGKEQGQAKRS
jgi:hypothetical protein